MADLHLVQVGFFKPILDHLEKEGANVERVLQKAGLNQFRLDSRERYVPAKAMYAFFNAVCRQEGIADLMGEFADLLHFINLAQAAEVIAYSPDLLTSCQVAVQNDQVIFTHERIVLEINGTRAKLSSCLIDNPAPGRDQTEFLNLAFILNAFRIAGGSKWAPLEIHLQHHDAPNLDVLLPIGASTKMYLGQPATAVVFPTIMLAWPMLGQEAQAQLSRDLPEAPATLGSKIEHLLVSNHLEVMPSLKQISEIADIPSRTLQRKLAEEGTAYSAIVDQWRFKTALEMLENPTTRVKEISSALRYANVPNFERAFRRWTRTTPRRFRALI